MGDMENTNSNIIYEDIDPEKIEFTDPYSVTYRKVRLGYEKKSLVLAPKGVYLHAYMQTGYGDTKSVTIYFNMVNRKEELTFCENIDKIYQAAKQHLYNNRKKLDLGQEIQLKYPLYTIEKEDNAGKFTGFKMFVKLMINKNDGEIYTNFFHEPKNAEEYENPKKLTKEEIYDIENEKSQNTYSIYPAVEIESIFIAPNKNLTMQCKLTEAFVRKKPKTAQKIQRLAPSLKISYKKDEETPPKQDQDPKDPKLDSDFEKLRKKAREHYKNTRY